MKRTNILIATALVAALLGGCNQAKTPNNVDLARRNADEDRAAQSMGAPSTSGKSQADINYDMAISSAETAHRAAVERCQALAVSEQQACRDRADADLEAARRAAQATRDSMSPNMAMPPATTAPGTPTTP